MKTSNQLQHVGTVEIETDRLRLRQFKLSDTQAMYDNWANDDRVSRYLTWPTHQSVDTSASIIESWVNSYKELDSYLWAIEIKQENVLIGSISVVSINESLRSMSIGYCIGYKYWNQGFVSEALKEVVKFLFNKTNVNRVSATHDVNNPASGKVMQKANLRFEGVLRQAASNNQGLCDLAVYSILRKEFERDE